MDPLSIAAAAAVIVAIVEVAKRTVAAWSIDPPNPDRYAPALSLVLGVAAGALSMLDGGVLAGLISGLTATGAYGGTKATVQGRR